MKKYKIKKGRKTREPAADDDPNGSKVVKLPVRVHETAHNN